MKSSAFNKTAASICLVVIPITVFMNNLVGTVALGFLATINTMMALNDK